MSEEIQPLSGSIEIERVIDGNEVRTFNVKTTILFLDDKAAGERYEGAGVDFENPVPVKNADGKVIGFATLSVEGKAVEADLYLDYHTPERLSIEAKTEPLYCHFTGYEAMDNTTGVWRVEHSTITELEIARHHNRDERITPL